MSIYEQVNETIEGIREEIAGARQDLADIRERDEARTEYGIQVPEWAK